MKTLMLLLLLDPNCFIFHHSSAQTVPPKDMDEDKIALKLHVEKHDHKTKELDSCVEVLLGDRDLIGKETDNLLDDTSQRIIGYVRMIYEGEEDYSYQMTVTPKQGEDE